MKYFTSATIFKNSWDQVTSAFWQKYPGPYSKHVLSEDVVARHVGADSKLYSIRLLTKTNRMPKWGSFIFGNYSRFVSIVEESIVDPKARTLTTYTRNIGYTNFMVLEEKCVFKPSQDNHSWTELHRSIWVNSSLYGVSRALIAFGVERYKANMAKSNKALQHIIDKLYMPETVQDTLPQEMSKLRNQATAKAQDMAAQARGVVQ
ncbi:PRELI domain-containing protein 1, mitochondrial-like [Diadema antillarum]|uniref:PRELI domain-containing protein 1, mitochondrial-like n=1 Tax=Diadema antillarum TaxID=105358 RepID=UPI003A8A69DA